MGKSEINDGPPPRSVESHTLKDGLVLMDSAGIVLGDAQAFGPKVRSGRQVSGEVAASRWVEIPIVGSDGEISGMLCKSIPTGDTLPTHRPVAVEMIEDAPQFIVHDISNLFAVIGSGLRLLKFQSDADYREAIIARMQEAITRGGALSRQLLGISRPRSGSIGGCVACSRLAAMAGTLDQALRTDVKVRSEIDPGLWDFNADPEELYFALLNLCRNSADAMPGGGSITVSARNVEPTSKVAREFVEIVVSDDGERIPENVLSQVFVPYFTTKAPGKGTGLGLPQLQRFVERRGGKVGIESERGGGTVVRLSLPSVRPSRLPGGTVAGEIAFVPTPDGGVFHVIDPTAGEP